MRMRLSTLINLTKGPPDLNNVQYPESFSQLGIKLYITLILQNNQANYNTIQVRRVYSYRLSLSFPATALIEHTDNLKVIES